jgi:phosphohistidine phosphatase SixA
MRRLVLTLLAVTAGVAPGAVAAAPLVASPYRLISPQDTAVVIYLVRHAERLNDTPDAPLNAAGEARARILAGLLQDAGVTRIWSTPLARTRSTAAPLAARLGLEVEPYDPARLEAFAGQLRATPGRHLVVGHSNTTPQLVRALGGEPRGDIAYDEYDRLYVMVIGEGAPITVLLRFGRSP